MQPIGKHRIRHLEGLQDGVWVTSGTSFEVSESAYLEHGYQPALDTLPWGAATPEDVAAGRP